MGPTSTNIRRPYQSQWNVVDACLCTLIYSIIILHNKSQQKIVILVTCHKIIFQKFLFTLKSFFKSFLNPFNFMVNLPFYCMYFKDFKALTKRRLCLAIFFDIKIYENLNFIKKIVVLQVLSFLHIVKEIYDSLTPISRFHIQPENTYFINITNYPGQLQLFSEALLKVSRNNLTPLDTKAIVHMAQHGIVTHIRYKS